MSAIEGNQILASALVCSSASKFENAAGVTSRECCDRTEISHPDNGEKS
ncbi:hypothetical protein [Microseira wollei]|nr:hypothetical protein [Microseira wollei]